MTVVDLDQNVLDKAQKGIKGSLQRVAKKQFKVSGFMKDHVVLNIIVFSSSPLPG